MTTALGFILLGVLLPVCTVAPGFFLVRRMRLGPLAKLCAALAASAIVLFLANFALYTLGLHQAVWRFGLSAVCAGLAAAHARELWRLLRCRQVRGPIIGFAVLVVWSIALLCLVRHFAGGFWGGDWLEHYDRARFFLGRLGRDHLFLQVYLLPARPPLMNVVCAHFLAQTGVAFVFYQLVTVYVSALLFLPCCLMARLMAPRRRGATQLLVCLFALNPMFCQNLAYPGTKMPACFFVILAVWMYLRGWRKQDVPLMAGAALTMTAGILVHYSAGPYALFLVLHYLVAVVWKRRRRAAELAAAIVPATALLAVWVLWSVAAYGVDGTFLSNTTVVDSQTFTAAQNLAKIGRNIYYTLVPHVVRGASMGSLNLQGRAGWWRDVFFLMYQTNLPAALGLMGWALVGVLVARSFGGSGRRAGRDQRRFWLALVVFCVVVGVAVHGAEDRFGLAHICLQSLVYLGLTLLAARLADLPAALRRAGLVGWFADFALGIFLPFRLARAIFRVEGSGMDIRVSWSAGGMPSRGAVGNWILKQDNGLTFLGDYAALEVYLVQLVILAGFGVLMWRMVRATGRGAEGDHG